MEWFTGIGATVCLPFGHSPHYDFIADVASRLIRVQVKTSARRRRNRFEIHVCTRGGNQSWNGLSKLLDASQFDELFVVVADGRRWRIPARAVQGGSAILLGGPKYAKFEVDPGPPLDAGALSDASTIAVPNARGDTQAVNGTRL